MDAGVVAAHWGLTPPPRSASPMRHACPPSAAPAAGAHGHRAGHAAEVTGEHRAGYRDHCSAAEFGAPQTTHINCKRARKKRLFVSLREGFSSGRTGPWGMLSSCNGPHERSAPTSPIAGMEEWPKSWASSTTGMRSKPPPARVLADAMHPHFFGHGISGRWPSHLQLDHRALIGRIRWPGGGKLRRRGLLVWVSSAARVRCPGRAVSAFMPRSSFRCTQQRAPACLRDRRRSGSRLRRAPDKPAVQLLGHGGEHGSRPVRLGVLVVDDHTAVVRTADGDQFGLAAPDLPDLRVPVPFPVGGRESSA